MRNRTAAIVAAALSAMVVVSPSANASLIFQIGGIFNGTPPTSTPPWLTADFETVATGTVTLILTSNLNVASEYIDLVEFNIDPSILPSSLTVVEGAHLNSGAATIVKGAQNAQNMNGGGSAGFGFDIELQFPNAAASRFNGTDVALFTLTGAGLTENFFNFVNTGNAAAHVGVHVNGIPAVGGGTISGAGSDRVAFDTVPEPATLALLGLSLAGLGFSRRKQ